MFREGGWRRNVFVAPIRQIYMKYLSRVKYELSYTNVKTNLLTRLSVIVKIIGLAQISTRV